MITAVILAAGESSRLGSPKQLLTIDGKTMLAHAVETALGSRCRDVKVITGAHAAQIEPTIKHYNVTVINNPDWLEGKASSIRKAVESVADDCTGILFLTCDQPHLTVDILNQLIDRFRVAEGKPAACQYAETLGIPAVIPRKMFGELQKLHGDQGAQKLLRDRENRIVTVPFAEGTIDIDTNEDLKFLDTTKPRESNNA